MVRTLRVHCMGQELDPWVLPRLTNKQTKTVTKAPTMFLTVFCAGLVTQL